MYCATYWFIMSVTKNWGTPKSGVWGRGDWGGSELSAVLCNLCSFLQLNTYHTYDISAVQYPEMHFTEHCTVINCINIALQCTAGSELLHFCALFSSVLTFYIFPSLVLTLCFCYCWDFAENKSPLYLYSVHCIELQQYVRSVIPSLAVYYTPTLPPPCTQCTPPTAKAGKSWSSIFSLCRRSKDELCYISGQSSDPVWEFNIQQEL